jgi:prepilin-type processing-associated H-X9-DG protein
LLVVIAIIAILAAILFPVFARARENARKSTCQSNLKQIGNALTMYRQDFDETNVYFCYGPSNSQTDDWVNNQAVPSSVGRYSWGVAILPYVKNTGVFRCPSLPPAMNRTTCASYLPFRWMSYGANFANVGTNGGRWMNNLDANITNSDLVTVSDGCGRFYTCAGRTSSTCTSITPGWQLPLNYNYEIPPNRECQRQPHLDGGNYLFYDGHVKWQKSTKISQYCPRL